MKAIIGSSVFLPIAACNAKAIDKRLTLVKWDMGAEEGTEVSACEWYDKYLAVPRHYGLQLISKLGLECVDRMSSGHPVDFPVNITHTGEYAYQDAFVKEILEAASHSNDFLVAAATGKGKTVCSLSVAQKLGRTTLVLVDQDNLLRQWVGQVKDKLKLPESRIGIVQGEKCEYEGKAVVIAMVQSLTRRTYDEAFYAYFGTVIVDEVHTVGAPTFSQVLQMFSARTRFGVSATVKRRDALQKLLHWNLGEIEVQLLDKHEASYVYYVESDTVYSWYANVSKMVGRILTEIAEDTDRNLLLQRMVEFMYGDGRDTLVVSDRIEQLEDIRAMCIYAGMPPERMGLYCGFRNVWGFTKNPKPKRRPHGYVRGTEYTPVQYGPIRKRIPKKELAAILEGATILFATFGMFTKGVDRAGLSGGVDCTPRSAAQQVHGRILRNVEGKLVPIWATVRDVHSYRLEHQFERRILEYLESSAEIYEWKIGKGVRLVDAKELRKEVRANEKELKALNISTLPDGRCMLVTPTTRSGRE